MHPSFIPWKHEKTVRFSDVFRGYRKGALGANGLIFKNITIFEELIGKNFHYFCAKNIWQDQTKLKLNLLNSCPNSRILKMILGNL